MTNSVTLRRQLQRECKNLLQLEALNGTRWLLLKNAENLNTDPEKNEKERLDPALELNVPLAKAYYLKDELRQFWQQDSKKKAKEWHNQWIKTARKSKVPMLMEVANTL